MIFLRVIQRNRCFLGKETELRLILFNEGYRKFVWLWKLEDLMQWICLEKFSRIIKNGTIHETWSEICGISDCFQRFTGNAKIIILKIPNKFLFSGEWFNKMQSSHDVDQLRLWSCCLTFQHDGKNWFLKNPDVIQEISYRKWSGKFLFRFYVYFLFRLFIFIPFVNITWTVA